MNGSLIQCNKEYIEKMLRASYPQNRVNDIVEFSFCCSGSYDGFENNLNRRSGLIGWFQLSASYADAMISADFIRYDDQGNYIAIRFDDLNAGANNPNAPWFFGYCHQITFSTFDRATIHFIGWKTNEEMYIPSAAPKTAGFSVFVSLDGHDLVVSNQLANSDFVDWYEQTLTAFTLQDAIVNYKFACKLPTLGGLTFADDYTIVGSGTAQVLNIPSVIGPDWFVIIGSTVDISADGSVEITSSTPPPPPTTGNVNIDLNASGANTLDSLVGVTLHSITLPLAAGSNVNGTYDVFSGDVELHFGGTILPDSFVYLTVGAVNYPCVFQGSGVWKASAVDGNGDQLNISVAFV